jgi:hypothetical protein
MKHNKASSPDGLPIEFYQFFWDIVGPDLLVLFNEFYYGRLDVSRFNYGMLTLLPKNQGADKLQAYRPIALINVILKIFTKVLNYRTIRVADKEISEFQTAFIEGRYILDGVVLLHETLHEIHRTKRFVVLFKVDFEKAYDKLDKDFQFHVILMKGFPVQLVEWVKKVVKDGSIAVMVNDQLGPYFKTLRGVRQGDPLPPIVFDLAVDVLAVLIRWAQEAGLIKSAISGLIEEGVVMMQYADDTVFLFEDNVESARNLKIILNIFEHFSGLKIIFLISEVCCFGGAVDRIEHYSSNFTCTEGKVPFKY